MEGCRYVLLVNIFTNYLDSDMIKHIDKEVLMEDIRSPSSVTIGELTRIVKEFEEKI